MSIRACRIYACGTLPAEGMAADWLRGLDAMRGLICRQPRPVIFAASAGIHTFGLREPIAVWLLAADGFVLAVGPCVQPCRVVYAAGVRWAVETPPGLPLPVPGTRVRCRVHDGGAAWLW